MFNGFVEKELHHIAQMMADGKTFEEAVAPYKASINPDAIKRNKAFITELAAKKAKAMGKGVEVKADPNKK